MGQYEGPYDCNLTYSSSRSALLLRVNVLFRWLNKSLALQYLVLDEEEAGTVRVMCHGAPTQRHEERPWRGEIRERGKGDKTPCVVCLQFRVSRVEGNLQEACLEGSVGEC